MAETVENKRTQKGEIARKRILECALRLFESKGYEQTTMREIAAEAESSLGLTYRYFRSKEELVLELYQNLCTELEVAAQELAPSSLAERFSVLVSKQWALMAPYRAALSALFGTTLNSHANAGVFSESTSDIRRHGRQTYLKVILEAKDAPKRSLCEDLATVLYGLHLALVLFWLIDESKQTERSRLLLGFVQDMLKLLQPVFWLPPLAQALARLATLLGPLLGDERTSSASS